MAETKLGPVVESFDSAKPAPTEQYIWAPEDECARLHHTTARCTDTFVQ
jgi:hypothetical protein